MPVAALKLPADLSADLDVFEGEVRRFLAGELAPSIFKARRVPRGIYEQRRDGTYMVRARLPGGVVTHAQLRALADVGSRFGNGLLHVTTRQDIQFHDVPIIDAPNLMRELLSAGITSKGGGGNTVRNVSACPYAGICPQELFDVTPYANAVTEYLITLPGSFNLPRKYKIAFSGCAADCALVEINDLGLVAQVRDGKPGFRVFVGGGMGAESRVGDLLADWIPGSEVIRTAETVRRLFDRLGDRRNRRQARLRFVLKRIGLDEFKKLFDAERAKVIADGVPEAPVFSVKNQPTQEMPPHHPRHNVEVRHGLRVLPQSQKGFVAVPLQLPLGEISCRDLQKLAVITERFSAEQDVRAVQTQSLLLRHVRETDLPELARTLSVERIAWNAPQPLQAFVACTGAATCRLGLCLSQNLARAAAKTLETSKVSQDVFQSVDIRISGCPNSCGHHPIGTVGLFGQALRVDSRLVPAYRVLLGARTGVGRTRVGTSIGIFAARAVPAALVSLLEDFQAGRKNGEALADYFDRKGQPYFEQLLTPHTAVPAYHEAPEYYRDWDQTSDFSLAGRGPGECGAGVFEVITEDIAAARKALADAGAAADPAEKLFAAVLAATRALLITRGLDSQQPDEIFRAFEKHFVETGLVGHEYNGLLARARGYREGWRDALAGRQQEIQAFIAQVDGLFGTLDADLKFQKPGAAAVAPSANAAGAIVELNLRGVACPMNFVKAKLRLESLAVGDVLRVVLDDGAPIQNVPASFRNEGQNVIEPVRLADGHWQVDVRKKH
jgi:sulfite reductase (ferredoxin)